MKVLNYTLFLMLPQGSFWEIEGLSVIDGIKGITATTSTEQALQQTSVTLTSQEEFSDPQIKLYIPTPCVAQCIDIIVFDTIAYIIDFFSGLNILFTMTKAVTGLYGYLLTTNFGRKKGWLYSRLGMQPSKPLIALQDLSIMWLFGSWLSLTFIPYVIFSFCVLAPFTVAVCLRLKSKSFYRKNLKLSPP